MSDWHVSQACMLLKAGAVIAYPTEGVWGLGCDPHNPAALSDLLAIKQRDAKKGFILVASHISQLDFLLADLPGDKQAVLAAHWPGPFTFLVPHRNLFLPAVVGQFSTIAVRVSNHPVVQQLCDGFGGPLISTSANLSGHAAARSAVQVRRQLGQNIDYLVPGELGGAKKPSRIIDLMSGRIIRP